MAVIGLSSPWVTFYREIEAFFKYDPEIRIIFHENTTVLNIYVDNVEKADALTRLLPTEKEFGSVVLEINVIPANKLSKQASLYLANEDASADVLFKVALANNGAVNNIVSIDGIFSNNMTYIVFKKEVVQYFNDSLGDINGLCSTLYQDIAKDIFGSNDGIYFCTDKDVKFNTIKAENITISPWNI